MGKRSIMESNNNDNQNQKNKSNSKNNQNYKAQHNNNSNSPQTGNREGFNLSLFGWRKKCLYALLFLLMVLITVNLSLTLWILRVMEVSSVS